MTSSETHPATPSPQRQGLTRLLQEQYGLHQAHLTLLREGDNSVFCVDVPSGERYALRLHSAEHRTVATIASELEWLDLLARTADLPVPQPIRNVFALWVTPFTVQSGRSVFCTLLTWLEGESLLEGQEFTMVQAVQAGQLLAQLHVRAEQFEVPAVFERPQYDTGYFLSSVQRLERSLAGLVEAQRLECLGVSLKQVIQELGSLNGLPGGFGLIHADVHPGNFLQQEEGLALLDFDRCGWGPFLLDLAHADLALEASGRTALVTGYTRIRPLPGGYESTLKALRLMAAVENLAFLSQRAHELPFVLEAVPLLEDALLMIQV